MRADRLIALLLLLQSRPKLTAAQVAQELEISERTARRDLEALAMSGVPIYSTPGRGGGWQLLGGASTDLTGLSADEAQAIFLALGPNLGGAPALKSAVQKLSGALPETFRADAAAAASAIKVDPAGWGHVGNTYTPPHLDSLTNAVIANRQVRLDYESPTTGVSSREVSPLGLVTKRDIWYLIANTAKGMRTFRVSRVRKTELLETPVDRPTDFDLEAEWERIRSEVESMRNGVTARIIAQPNAVRALRFQFSGRIEFTKTYDDGRQVATISELGVGPLAAQLASHGASIEVLGPSPELRSEFERLARELQATWLHQDSS